MCAVIRVDPGQSDHDLHVVFDRKNQWPDDRGTAYSQAIWSILEIDREQSEVKSLVWGWCNYMGGGGHVSHL